MIIITGSHALVINSKYYFEIMFHIYIIWYLYTVYFHGYTYAIGFHFFPQSCRGALMTHRPHCAHKALTTEWLAQPYLPK